jgi:hypothetical protein
MQLAPTDAHIPLSKALKKNMKLDPEKKMAIPIRIVLRCLFGVAR